MECTREMLKDQLYLCKIQKKTFERSFNISLVNSMCLGIFSSWWYDQKNSQEFMKEKTNLKKFKNKKFFGCLSYGIPK